MFVLLFLILLFFLSFFCLAFWGRVLPLDFSVSLARVESSYPLSGVWALRKQVFQAFALWSFLAFFSLSLWCLLAVLWRFRGKQTAPRTPSQREASVCSPLSAPEHINFHSAAIGHIPSHGLGGQRNSLFYPKPREVLVQRAGFQRMPTQLLSGQVQTSREDPTRDSTLRFSLWSELGVFRLSAS